MAWIARMPPVWSSTGTHPSHGHRRAQSKRNEPSHREHWRGRQPRPAGLRWHGHRPKGTYFLFTHHQRFVKQLPPARGAGFRRVARRMGNRVRMPQTFQTEHRQITAARGGSLSALFRRRLRACRPRRSCFATWPRAWGRLGAQGRIARVESEWRKHHGFPRSPASQGQWAVRLISRNANSHGDMTARNPTRPDTRKKTPSERSHPAPGQTGLQQPCQHAAEKHGAAPP